MENFITFESVAHVTTEEYFAKGGDFSIHTYKNKYPIDEIEKQFPAKLFWRIAKIAASYEATPELQDYWAKRWFHEFWIGLWRPAGSILSGLGHPGKISISNCTTLELKDDTLEAIFETAYKTAKSAAYRQGLGIDFSKLRPAKTKISNSAKISTGSVSWMDFINVIGHYVGQSGRIPAMLMSLNISHPDIIDFITAKSNLHKIPNANISVQITDDFMKAYEEDKDWELKFDVKDDKGNITESVRKNIKAKELMARLAKEACDFAEPGVQFIDTCIRESITDVLGFPILSANACSEKFMHPDSTCVLLSVNVAMFPIEGYESLLIDTAKGMVRFADNCVQYELSENKTPYANQHYVVSQLREIGIGVTNLNGWLLKDYTAYDSEKGITRIEEFVRTLSLASWRESIALGKEKGNAPAFQAILDKNKGDNSFIYQSVFAKRLKEEAGIDVTHLRNSNVMSIAPTGSLSLTFPEEVEATGIEPLLSFFYWKRSRTTGSWEWFFVIPAFVRKKLAEEGYTDIPTTVHDPKGEIGEKWVDIINKFFDPSIYKPAHFIDPLKKVELMSKVAKWVDSSISVTYNLKEDATPELVEKIYYEAWKQGVKSIAVYRDKSREGVIEIESPRIVEKRFGSHSKRLATLRPDKIEIHAAAKRPKELPCKIHRTSIKGHKFIVLIGLLHESPYEVFIADADDMKEIPASLDDAVLLKTHSRKYNLVSTDKTLIKDISAHIGNHEYEAKTRLISLALRTGAPIDYVVEQLEKIQGTVVDASAAIARILRKYITVYYRTKQCQECGSTEVDFKEGCFICISCGNSKCG